MLSSTGRWLNEVYKNRVNYYFLAPMYVLFIVFLIIPSVQAFYYALFDFKIGSDRIFVGLANFATLIKEGVFWTAVKNTFIIALVVVPTSIFAALIVSVVIIRRNQLVKSFVRAAFYLPIALSAVTLSLTWDYIYDPAVGLANYLLGLMGMEPVVWLGDASFALTSIMIILFTTHLGVPVVLFTAALGGIPETYYESARIDGASRFRQFVHITLPMIKPTMLYLVVTNTIGTFQVFVFIKLLTSGGPMNSTQTLAYLLYEKAFVFGEYGLASAVGVVLFLVVTLIAFVQYKYLSTDIEY